ncbi:MAG: helix-turn-helix transcriptional regulator [Leifsonia sp.]
MSEFATVLRSWRDRVDPAEVGLPAGPGRRTPGLRREELAALTGVSVDYIVRLVRHRRTAASRPFLRKMRATSAKPRFSHESTADAAPRPA